MKITDIKQQVKRQDRYSIFIDGKYAFSLSENELMPSDIRVGREYSKSELEDLKQKAVLDKAYMRALDMLSRRARSEWELRNYLKRKGYEAEVIDLIIEKMQQNNHIDDLAFARAWVGSRRLLKSVSQRRLWQELKQKKVSDEVIKQVLEEDETPEIDVIKELVVKKRHQSRYQDEQKLIAYLVRQGFGYQDIKQALDTENVD